VIKDTFATCELGKVGDETGLIQMLQLVGQGVALKGSLSNLAANTEYELRIQEFGDITGGCTKLGDEFNPWVAEHKDPYAQRYGGWDHQYAYVDPWEGIGKIDNVTSDADGNVTFRQNGLEQNLDGDDSLIGRSIGLYEKDDDTVLGCCVIAVDTYRQYEETPAPNPEDEMDEMEQGDD